jgi:hypothetical protein
VCGRVHVYLGTKYLVPENLINTLNSSSGSSTGGAAIISSSAWRVFEKRIAAARPLSHCQVVFFPVVVNFLLS